MSCPNFTNSLMTEWEPSRYFCSIWSYLIILVSNSKSIHIHLVVIEKRKKLIRVKTERDFPPHIMPEIILATRFSFNSLTTQEGSLKNGYISFKICLLLSEALVYNPKGYLMGKLFKLAREAGTFYKKKYATHHTSKRNRCFSNWHFDNNFESGGSRNIHFFVQSVGIPQFILRENCNESSFYWLEFQFV